MAAARRATREEGKVRVMNHPPEPTPEECSARTKGTWEGQEIIATWFPQLGGYVGKAVVVIENGPADEPDGPDIWVWHNGEFPFTGEDEMSPVNLHVCIPGDHVAFWKWVESWEY